MMRLAVLKRDRSTCSGLHPLDKVRRSCHPDFTPTFELSGGGHNWLPPAERAILRHNSADGTRVLEPKTHRSFNGFASALIQRHPKFTQDEGPRLVEAATALYPRWSVFILTGLLESAALMRSDIDFGRGRLHVQRTISGRGAVAPSKNGKDRWVKASPALLKALRGQLEAIDLDGSLKDWSPEQRLPQRYS